MIEFLKLLHMAASCVNVLVRSVEYICTRLTDIRALCESSLSLFLWRHDVIVDEMAGGEMFQSAAISSLLLMIGVDPGLRSPSSDA